MFKELRWFFKKEWFKYLLVLIFTLIYTFSLLITPKIIGDVVTNIANTSLTKQYAISIFVLMIVVAVVIYVSAALKNRILGGINHKLFYELKTRYLANIFKQDGDFFEEHHSGDLISRATGDTNMIARVATHLLFNLVDTVVSLIFAFVAMYNLSIKLTLYSIIPLPLIFLIVMYLRPKIMRNWREVRKEVSHLNDLVMESVTHVKLVRGFVKEKEDEVKLSNKADLVYRTARKSVLMQSVFMPSFRMVTLISQGIALGLGAYLIMKQNDFTVGNLVSFNLYLGMFAGPLFRLGNQITVISQSKVSFERVNEILNAIPTIQDMEDAIRLERVEKIEFRDLSFKYPKDEEYTIKDINLTISRGKTLGVVGKTGSGKTTLLRQLLRMYVIDKGNIIINGIPINQYEKLSIRNNIAYVPQEHILFSRTVLENLELGLSNDTILEIDEAVEMADFKKDLAYLTDDLETIVGESGVTLSGGQKQRLSIARAFLKNSEVLIMDDSLSAVDGVTEANILQNLKEFRKDKTNIISSHRLSAIEHADEIIVLDKGRIVERGTHQELIANKKWYYEQYLIQQMEDGDE
jgi:ATP-binding cassette subfamily B protein